jgi:hypothetical protein
MAVGKVFNFGKFTFLKEDEAALKRGSLQKGFSVTQSKSSAGIATKRQMLFFGVCLLAQCLCSLEHRQPGMDAKSETLATVN